MLVYRCKRNCFLCCLNQLEEKGYSLIQAEALAYATVMVLDQRLGGPVGLPMSQNEPKELAEYVAMVREVFGPAVMRIQ